MADKKQPSEGAGTRKTEGKADGKKGAVAKAADGLASKLAKGGKAAAAKAADMAGTSSRSSKAAGTVADSTGTGASGASPKATPRKKLPDLKKDLRDFAAGRPNGWGHEDWLQFLESLQSRGHNIADREAIGTALERERLDFALTSVKGLGPQRRQALVERYGTLWALRAAAASEIAKAGNLPADLAQRVKTELPGAR